MPEQLLLDTSTYNAKLLQVANLTIVGHVATIRGTS